MMITNQDEVLAYLDSRQIKYTLAEHEAVFTVEQSDKIKTGLSGIGTKNLFMRDKKGSRMFLAVVDKNKKVDLKRLAPLLKTDRLSFGSAERLEKHLGVQPGSVTILAVMNDPEKVVELFIDEDIWQAESFTCHPMINTATLEIPHDGLVKFLEELGRSANIITIPEQDTQT